MADNTKMVFLALGIVALMLAGFMTYNAMNEPSGAVQQQVKAPSDKIYKSPTPAEPSSSTGLVTITIGDNKR